jgi:glycolate oxidase FAD binding subunit
VDLGHEHPPDREALCDALRRASEAQRRLRIVGGGSGGRCGLRAGGRADPISTRRLDRVLAHEPADLIVTVEAGVHVSTLQAALATHGQTWIQAPEIPGSTVGGLLARAASGHRRLRYGAIRDSVLQIVVATGDGRLVQAGGKTVKGVAGYDIPRLMVGAHGTLGVIVEATLKLWPLPPSSGWFTAEGSVDELARLGEHVRRTVHQPAAILLAPARLDIELIGPPEDLSPPGGMRPAGAPPVFGAAAVVEAGVRPSVLPRLTAKLADRGYAFQAQLGVGICQVAVTDRTQRDEVRALAATSGGHAVIVDAPDELRDDPWGPPPDGLAIMGRLKASFDPAGILNRGQFIGDRAGAQ